MDLINNSVLGALCIVHFLHNIQLADLESEIPFQDIFMQMSSEEKISWLNEYCCTVVQDTFFENEDDIFSFLREILENLIMMTNLGAMSSEWKISVSFLWWRSHDCYVL